MAILFMFDNHTFERLSDDVPLAIKRAAELFDMSNGNYGSVGVKDGKINELVVHARGDKNRFVHDLSEWARNYSPPSS